MDAILLGVGTTLRHPLLLVLLLLLHALHAVLVELHVAGLDLFASELALAATAGAVREESWLAYGSIERKTERGGRIGQCLRKLEVDPARGRQPVVELGVVHLVEAGAHVGAVGELEEGDAAADVGVVVLVEAADGGGVVGGEVRADGFLVCGVGQVSWGRCG